MAAIPPERTVFLSAAMPDCFEEARQASVFLTETGWRLINQPWSEGSPPYDLERIDDRERENIANLIRGCDLFVGIYSAAGSEAPTSKMAWPDDSARLAFELSEADASERTTLLYVRDPSLESAA